MRALITGGAGFIGSHLAEHLLSEGDDVTVLDNLSTGRFENIRQLVGKARFRYFIGPVEDERLFSEAADGSDVIFHLAAAVGVELIVRDPVGTIETNVVGAQGVLHHAVRYGKRVLVASTSEVYGKSMKVPFSEEDDVVYGPTSKARWSYAISKAVDEFLVRAYAKTRGLPGIVVRLFNTVGPRQVGHYGMVIPRFVTQALRGGPITVYGSGEQKRCFGHVLDVVPALRKLALLPSLDGQIVNVGNDVPISILELAEKVRAKIRPEAEIRFVPYEAAYGSGFEDMMTRQPCLDRVRSLIGYRPERDIDTILADVVEYIRLSESTDRT
ncbi:MAG: GDP-mannose 4,6-dehydratase [Thermoanaerobaculia bacterium]|nr:GDP-mannose 4,6-dehydratase [Thermoanaerobaculia bacterium]